ncbi:hypothetical protein FOIG_06854 [Fusarium odoratissimum NRRL 54006]|uniref:Uncharacterized protein n=2 Tax=Fusarium oxysporum species complex TaxID=171631 RepID=X0JN38_FUSO5|nr:uncharacterized protein FOIG_06854 [Fusarium odoratissimum NRRL 54006]EXM02714.1 hypothetical protein FOIG_06854 [Fusarium odoratissimum NRRL 54006]TXC08487.1 hypothetical protein FocTR4_00003631 [Fusarium oxysporum f. sp. cubense]
MDLLIREHAEAMLEERKGGVYGRLELSSSEEEMIFSKRAQHIDEHSLQAVIKESPRLYPLGSDLKQAPPGTTITTHDGRRLPNANGLIMTASTHTIHYDANIYPDPHILSARTMARSREGTPGTRLL